MSREIAIFGNTVESVLADSTLSSCKRDLDLVELWSGVGNLTKAAAQAGHKAECFDIGRIPGVTDNPQNPECEDICTENGFRRALHLVLRLRPQGLLWEGVDCSSFGFLNASKTRRSTVNGYRGNWSYKKVQVGNLMAKIATFFMLLCQARGVTAIIENPVGSALFKYLEHAWGLVPAFSATCARCRFATERFGQRILKRYHFIGTASWMESLNFSCRCGACGHRSLVKTSYSKDGKKQVTGIKHQLRESGVYPWRLALAIIKAWSGKGIETTQREPVPRKRSWQTLDEPAVSVSGGTKPASSRSWQDLPVNDPLGHNVSRSKVSRSQSWRNLPLE